MTDTQQLLKDHIIGLAHVGFIVPSLEDAMANACRVYGLAPADFSCQPPPGEEASTRFAFFRVGDLQFELIEPRSAHFREVLLGMPSGGAGINHVAWRVDDIEAAVAVLGRNGIRPGHVTPEGIVTIGARKMVYLDLATTGGLVIELIEYPAQASDVSQHA